MQRITQRLRVKYIIAIYAVMIYVIIYLAFTSLSAGYSKTLSLTLHQLWKENIDEKIENDMIIFSQLQHRRFNQGLSSIESTLYKLQVIYENINEKNHIIEYNSQYEPQNNPVQCDHDENIIRYQGCSKNIQFINFIKYQQLILNFNQEVNVGGIDQQYLAIGPDFNICRYDPYPQWYLNHIELNQFYTINTITITMEDVWYYEHQGITQSRTLYNQEQPMLIIGVKLSNQQLFLTDSCQVGNYKSYLLDSQLNIVLSYPYSENIRKLSDFNYDQDELQVILKNTIDNTVDQCNLTQLVQVSCLINRHSNRKTLIQVSHLQSNQFILLTLLDIDDLITPPTLTIQFAYTYQILPGIMASFLIVTIIHLTYIITPLTNIVSNINLQGKYIGTLKCRLTKQEYNFKDKLIKQPETIIQHFEKAYWRLIKRLNNNNVKCRKCKIIENYQYPFSWPLYQFQKCINLNKIKQEWLSVVKYDDEMYQ